MSFDQWFRLFLPGPNGLRLPSAAGFAPSVTVGLLDQGIAYQAPQHSSWSLPAGDESALPAVAGVLRSAPRDLRGAALLEIAHPDDAQDMGQPDACGCAGLTRTDDAMGAWL
jgi:NADPH-dependent ferric siderophore reductase